MTACRSLLRAHMNQTVQERAGGDDNGARDVRRAVVHDHARHTTRACGQPRDLAKHPGDVRFPLEGVGHPSAVLALIGLRPRRPDGRTAASIEQLELDSGRVDRTAHQPAKRVNLANQVPLCRSTNGGIARHVRHRVTRQRAQCHVTSHSRRGVRGLDASVTGPQNDNVKLQPATPDYFPMQNFSKM